MKYGKLIDGNVEQFTPYKGGLILDDMLIINPTNEQFLQAGWFPIEFIDELGTPIIENNVLKVFTKREKSLEELKTEKLNEIDNYDTSSAVNGFYLNDKELWADKVTRMGLINAAQCAKLMGKDTLTFGIQGLSLTLPCDQCIQLLGALEMYALDCYNTTLMHKNTVDRLNDKDLLKDYDYTLGYPEKLRFTL